MVSLEEYRRLIMKLKIQQYHSLPFVGGGLGWGWSLSLYNAACAPPSLPSPLIGEGVEYRYLERFKVL
jgi:hypothetical protein